MRLYLEPDKIADDCGCLGGEWKLVLWVEEIKYMDPCECTSSLIKL